MGLDVKQRWVSYRDFLYRKDRCLAGGMVLTPVPFWACHRNYRSFVCSSWLSLI